MKLEEKHRQFAVKCFAQFMTRTEVTDAFLEEFSDVRLAHNILKTIATHNLLKQNEKIENIKPQDTKALTDT